MMRGLRPLLAIAVAVAAANAGATEMVEIPTPPPAPPAPCCTAVLKAPSPPGSLLVDVLVGPTYRRAFDDDFAGALLEVELGGQNESFGMGARISATFGGTSVGLPYQVATIGPAANFRISPRVRLAVGATFGVFMYERATIPGDVVWALTAGGNLGATVDLLRTARGGALYALVASPASGSSPIKRFSTCRCGFMRPPDACEGSARRSPRSARPAGGSRRRPATRARTRRSSDGGSAPRPGASSGGSARTAAP